ncbi:MAG: deoxyribonuclease IV [Endomicrobiia bacterium]
MKIGVHCSIRKGYKGALYEAKELGCNCLQMFTHSPRIWKLIFPSKQEIEEFKELRKKLKLSPLVIHTAYLPNPASSNKEIYIKTRKLLLLEFELAFLFEAEYLVMHPGSYSEGKTPKEGINNIVKSIDFCFENIFKKFKNINFKLLLENVCGNGRKIGRTFKELGEIISESKYKKYIGICIDTAHCFAYGYDISTVEGLETVLKEIKENIGLNKIKLIHLNDSKVSLGSRIDQHYHIAKGYIGENGIKNILKYFKDLPFILETPKESSFDKISQKDKENIDITKKLYLSISS